MPFDIGLRRLQIIVVSICCSIPSFPANQRLVNPNPHDLDSSFDFLFHYPYNPTTPKLNPKVVQDALDFMYSENQAAFEAPASKARETSQKGEIIGLEPPLSR